MWLFENFQLVSFILYHDNCFHQKSSFPTSAYRDWTLKDVERLRTLDNLERRGMGW